MTKKSLNKVIITTNYDWTKKNKLKGLSAIVLKCCIIGE